MLKIDIFLFKHAIYGKKLMKNLVFLLTSVQSTHHI